ncbi:protein gurken [Drosophila hydei]|uniref:Protein gurken n=1 Tax=Drosophila hydei TaxID=7224 RepID=A0A6J2SSI0_DROHY|nr:protein gurken [Drosophila hydei]
MQIQCLPIFKVIFVLSTIVAVTDCCSSRILLLRQQTLQIEEHVVQLVNQLELQQQLNIDGQPSATDVFADTAQMLQMSSALNIDGELATIATTERDSNIGVEPWFNDEETTTTTTTITTPTTTTRSTEISSTTISATVNTMATGEPPPDDSTPQLATDAGISQANEALQTTTMATTTTTATAAAATITAAAATAATTQTLSTTMTTTMTTTNTEDLSFKLPCSNTYMKYFCLNGGNCFRWAESENGFSYCVCAVGFVGERCDSKTENGVYVPLRPTTEPQLKTARIVFSFPMLMLLSTIYVLFGAVFMLRNVSAQRRKQQQLHLHKQRFFVSC